MAEKNPNTNTEEIKPLFQTREIKVDTLTREQWILDCFPEWGTWLNEEIDETAVEPNTLAMWWLGCTGIYMKTPNDTNIMVDAWVSKGKHTHNFMGGFMGPDFHMTRMCGAKNLYPNLKNSVTVIDPWGITKCDAVFATHFHADHIDAYIAAAVLQNCPGVRFIGPLFCKKMWLGWGVPEDRITVVKPGDVITIKDVEVHVVESFDRTAMLTVPPTGSMKGVIPEMDERAVNYVFKTPGCTVYHSGDSHFANTYAKHGKDFDIDVAFASYGCNPIGITDKLTASDICKMAECLNCKVMIPVHHDLWTTTICKTSDIEMLWESNRYMLDYKWKPYIWQVGGKFVWPDDKDKREYMYPRGFEDRYSMDINLPFTSFI